MTTAILLLLSALCYSVENKPIVKPKDILDFILNLTEHPVEEDLIFVDNVKYLTESNGRCDERFFCKVHDILDNLKVSHNNGSKIEAIARNLEQFNNLMGVNCQAVLRTLQPLDDSSIQVVTLKERLKYCIQHQNFQKIDSTTQAQSTSTTPAE